MKELIKNELYLSRGTIYRIDTDYEYARIYNTDSNCFVARLLHDEHARILETKTGIKKAIKILEEMDKNG